jgi:hypothetical protein
MTRWLRTLKMEAIRSSVTSVHTRSTRRHIPEDAILRSHRRENLRSYKYGMFKTLQFKETRGNIDFDPVQCCIKWTSGPAVYAYLQRTHLWNGLYTFQRRWEISSFTYNEKQHVYKLLYFKVFMDRSSPELFTKPKGVDRRRKPWRGRPLVAGWRWSYDSTRQNRF